MIAPIVEELAAEYSGKLKIAKLNTDENQATAYQFGIRGIPTLKIFRGGQTVETIIGAVSKKQLKSKIEEQLQTSKTVN